MTTTVHKLADALREIALPLQQAVAEGRRLQFETEDVAEFLLVLADRIDPPFPPTPTAPSLLDASSRC